MRNAEQIALANKIPRIISSQISLFEEHLPDNKCVAIVLGNNVIEIKEVISLDYFGLLAIEGLCRTVVSPQYCGAPIRVLLAPVLQGLTLIGVSGRGRSPEDWLLNSGSRSLANSII